MRALVVANSDDDDAGYVGERLVERGYELVLGYRDEPGALPSNLDGLDLLVMLGSDWSTYWEHVRDEVERESALVREAGVRDLPTLGICYGAQLMAHALGGSVQQAAQTEIGWFTLDTTDEVLAPAGPWFEFHIDAFTPPAGAEVLATTSAGPQAFRIGRMLAWQFHPEVTPGIVRRWGAGSRDQASRAGVDLEQVYAQTDAECTPAPPPPPPP
ncbi:MAG: gamma-glutamyl-gamma-aminobutyrate hydrolase family protein, partial [Actinomycetota bacterium]|nr:gamma-glutamyl-gamma-aminobutyrate hydrolase family protein [Actinomycetota bacterium]